MSATKPVMFSEFEQDSIQPRAETCAGTIARYAEQMVIGEGELVITPGGDPWPNLTAFIDPQGRLWLADGWHRIAAARSIGARSMQTRIKPGSKMDALKYALGANARHGLPLSNADKRRIVELALTTTHTEATAGALAAELGFVSQPFVSKVRRDLELQGRVQAAAARRGADGKMYTAASAPAPAEVKTVLTPAEDDPQVDLEREAQRRSMEQIVGRVVTPERVAAAGVPVRQAVGEVIDPAHQSGDDLDSDASGDEWSTPSWLIELCCDVVGLFDTDPASNEAARKIVGAPTYYTKQTNGLDKAWHGNVWLNPPYSRDLVKAFAQKAVSEWGRCNAKMMFVLVNTSSSAAWWHQLARAATLTIFLPKRVDFWHPDGRAATSNRYDQTLFFFSLDPKRVALCRKVFGAAGALIVEACEDDD